MSKHTTRHRKDEFDPVKLRQTLARELQSGNQTVDRLLNKLEKDPEASRQVSEDDAKLSRYEVGQFIAKGGMGAIYNVMDRDINRSVAMKVMRVGGKATPMQIGLFVNEARITGQLEHPNIVPVHELGVSAAGTVFYTMKHVRGLTLKEIIKSIADDDSQMIRKYPLSALLTIFQKTCDAVAFAHSKGVIHRDLKPDNIMIGDYGEVLVLDWGLAKVVDKITDESLTAEVMRHMEEALEQAGSQDSKVGRELDQALDTGDSKVVKPAAAAAGTPSYMSPEQTLADPDRIDGRADIYGLGGILYTILTLDVPLRADTVIGLMNLKREGAIEPPTDYNKEDAGKAPLRHLPGGRVPHALSAIAMKALATKPADRYRTIAELQKDLEAYQGGYATAAEQAGSLRVLWLLFRRRWREAATLIVSLVLLAVVILIFAVSQMHSARTQKRLYEEQKKTYDELVQATAEREQISRQAAPEFLYKAKSLAEKQDWQGALHAIEVSQTLNPSLAEAKVVELRLLLAARKFEAARAVLKGIDPQALTEQVRGDCRLYAGLVETFGREAAQNAGKLPYARCLELAARFRSHSDWPAAKHLYLDTWRDCMEEGNLKIAIEAAVLLTEMENPGVSRMRYTYTLEGDRVELDLSANPELTDLSSLADLPLTRLSLADCPKLMDIDSLRHMPLLELDLSNTGIRDLESLRNLELARLVLDKTKVQKFTPLEDLPLRHLSLRWTSIHDLADINDLPLISLDLSYCRNLSDLRPLSRMRGLRELILQKTAVFDLRPLRSLRLRKLNLNNTRVRDLTSLRMISTLEELHLDWTGIRDVSPLTTLDLRELTLYHSDVENLNPLGGMPLERLDVGKCRGVRDVRVLSTCKRLTHLRLPRQAKNIHELKRLKNLKYLSYEDWDETATEFWSRQKQ